MEQNLTRDLTEEVIQKSLDCIGKHPFTQSHAYLAFRASGMGIQSIQNISRFPYLMYVDISENSIQNLEPLDDLIGLVQLNARCGALLLV